MTSTGTCVECGNEFSYRRRGIPQVTCGRICSIARARRLSAKRQERFVLAATGVGVLGYPETLSCRSVSPNALQAGTCGKPTEVIYVGRAGLVYALCAEHDSPEAAQLAELERLVRVSRRHKVAA